MVDNLHIFAFMAYLWFVCVYNVCVCVCVCVCCWCVCVIYKQSSRCLVSYFWAWLLLTVYSQEFHKIDTALLIIVLAYFR